MVPEFRKRNAGNHCEAGGCSQVQCVCVTPILRNMDLPIAIIAFAASLSGFASTALPADV